MPYLATMSGLDDRRAERAIHDLKAAGIIAVHPICEKTGDTVYKGTAAFRSVNSKLSSALAACRLVTVRTPQGQREKGQTGSETCR